MGTDDENIENLIAFVDCSRVEAEAFIKVSWDESQFHYDRTEENGPMNDPSASFNIESSDTLNPSVFGGAAGTRPPSRVSNHAYNDGGPELPHYGPQYSGVTNVGGNFRRADQEHYDTAQWSMVVQSPTAREYVDPDNRKREPGVPAAMKPISNDNFLPPLLTILYAVPMAKEALLARGTLLQDYGQSSEWWDGNPIALTRIVSYDDPLHNADWEETVHETQRVMAFMDHTERAYGTVYNLIQTAALKRRLTCGPGDYLTVWQQSAEKGAPGEALNKIFQTTAYNDPGEIQAGDFPTQNIFEVAVSIGERGKQLGPSLYEHLDDLLWTQDTDGGEPKKIHMDPGEILVFNVSSNDHTEPGLDVDIPAILYADRYLKENFDVTRKLRKERMEIFDSITKEEDRQYKLKSIRAPKSSKYVDAGELLGFAQDFFAESEDKSGTVRNDTNGNELVDVGTNDLTFKYGDVAKELKEIAVRVTEKVKAHDDLKARTIEQLHAISNVYKEPSSDSALKPARKYTLRGVATSPNTTYLLSNPSPTEDLLDTATEDWVWHKITYTSSSSIPPISHARVSESDVLQAAKFDSRRVLLVYASDAAISHPLQPLPPQLKNFVRADNLNFQKEIDEHDAASNHAELDDTDRDLFDGNPPWTQDQDWRSGGTGPWKQNGDDPETWKRDARNLSYDPSMQDMLRPLEPDAEPPPYESLGPPPMPKRYMGEKSGVMKQADVEFNKYGGFGAVSIPGGHGAGAGEGARGGYAREVRMEDVEEGR